MAAEDSVELVMLEGELELQATIVKGLKESKADKEKIDEAVAKLLDLKRRVAEAKGEKFEEPSKKDKKKKGKEADESKVDSAAERERVKAERLAKRNQKAEAADAPTLLMADLRAGSPFGVYQMVRSESHTDRKFTDVPEMVPAKCGQAVCVRGFCHTVRPTGAKRAFIKIRQGIFSVQACVSVGDGVSKDMLEFVKKISPESVIDVEGVLVKAPELVESTSQKEVEIAATRVYVVSAAAPQLPFQLEDAMAPGTGDEDQEKVARGEVEEHADGRHHSSVGQEIRLNYRWIDLRTPANQAIFRLQGVTQMLFRNYLIEHGFNEIHSPKIIGGSSEGGAEVFHIDYFGGDACLAQSPQFYKQMAICSGLQRVFEIGPVFRAENSNTNRHLTEFMGLDLEMEFKEDYHEVLDVMSELFISIFDGLGSEKYRPLREAVCEQHPFEPLEYLRPSLVLKWPEALAMLREQGREIGDEDDFDTPTEKFLGKLVKEKYHTDFFILDKFPTKVRPFYTMVDPIDPRYSNSYDIFLRGQEIMSGAQRVHDADMLIERIAWKGMTMSPGIQSYVDSFRHGAPPHAGGGIGLERIVMLYLGLRNIRKTTMFPRDPKRTTP